VRLEELEQVDEVVAGRVLLVVVVVVAVVVVEQQQLQNLDLS
jgi:hypothetical protein